MSSAGDLTEAKAALRAMWKETVELESAVEGSMTEAVAAWLAPQYALAARKRLAAAGSDSERFEILRQFAQDWALLRQGDQTAERLELERDRVAIARQDSHSKWKRRIIVGLETFVTHVKEHPEAQAAFDELARLLRHPFDPAENPTESD